MLRYADQPTPPFNSPYQQHASRTTSLLESPYPSPVRNESRSKYPQGLGLYDYQQPLPAGMPPSPQPSEAWGGQYSTGASPLMSEALADPWSSGAFDHPVSRSPLPWASSDQTSPRSSLSSYTREMSPFSHEGSEPAFAGVKMEAPVWGSEVQFGADRSTQINRLPSSRQPPLTVAPERLNAGMFPYDGTYTSPELPRYEPAPVFAFNDRNFERSIGSLRSRARPNYTAVKPRERIRNRRHTDPARATFHCHLCNDKGFARRYNYNQHLLTHQRHRKKENVCSFPNCGKEFVRKTDLGRHIQSVHERTKPFRCSRCPSAFSRKDTLRRHEDDGCPRRVRIPVSDPHLLSQRNDGYQVGAGL